MLATIKIKPLKVNNYYIQEVITLQLVLSIGEIIYLAKCGKHIISAEMLSVDAVKSST